MSNMAAKLIQRPCGQADLPVIDARPLSWRQTGLALGAALLLFGSACAADTAEASDTSALELYQQAQYTQAAARGLTELLREPWNHSLRFLVADSLQRSGKFDDATIQFQALEGTPYASSAALRLNALGSAAPVPKLPPAAAPSSTIMRQIVARTQEQASPEEQKTDVQALTPPKAAIRAAARSLTQHHFYDMYNAEDYQAVLTAW